MLVLEESCLYYLTRRLYSDARHEKPAKKAPAKSKQPPRTTVKRKSSA